MIILDFLQRVLTALPGAVSQGVLWGVMTLGVYLTFRILNVADMTVDGSFAAGGAITAILIVNGMNPYFTLLFVFFIVFLLFFNRFLAAVLQDMVILDIPQLLQKQPRILGSVTGSSPDRPLHLITPVAVERTVRSIRWNLRIAVSGRVFQAEERDHIIPADNQQRADHLPFFFQ